MILPNVRASFGAGEVELLLNVFQDRIGRGRAYWEEVLAREGLDPMLDHPALLSAVMEGPGLNAVSPRLAFYVMVRHTLRDAGLDDVEVADYVAALLVEFAIVGRAQRIARYDEKTYDYLVDIVSDLEEESSEHRRFLLRAHLGNYSLWLSGLFPDYVVARVHRKGAPGIHYYEDLGAIGYQLASESELAGRHDLSRIYREVADGFSAVRRALNRVSDRIFFPVPPSPVDRLLRQVADDSGFN